MVRLIAELHQSHSHGQTQTPHQDIEHTSHVTETQRAGLILQGGDTVSTEVVYLDANQTMI